MKIFWNQVTWYSKLAAIVVFVGAFGLGIYLGMLIAEVPPPIDQAPGILQAHPATSTVYKNLAYNFEITFPPAWKSYQVVEVAGAPFLPGQLPSTLKSFEFYTKTSDTAAQDKNGQFEVFEIMVFPQKDWDQIKAMEKKQPKDDIPYTEGISVLAEKNGLVFTLEGRQEYPNDIDPALYVPTGTDFFKFTDASAQPVSQTVPQNVDDLIQELAVIIKKPGATLDDVRGFLFDKYGPCWGIPDGQCKE